KSTLLVTAGGMLAPTEGTVRFGDAEVYALSQSERAALRRTRLGFVFQTFNLIPYLSCDENVALPALLAGRPRKAAFERAGALLEQLSLGGRRTHRPSELSVGERQRTAICRSLINEPEVVFADEPTGNLDSRMTGEVMDILCRLNAGGQTILMATHDPRLAGRGTRILSLENGRIVEDRKVREAAAR
ncbi:MAG: ABC transporter ATP-binding protein, partial [Elusimicrobia bacterium]|nr:ABC transporter ATP-binding protein [Elusimicrobiota bacterium]